MEGEIIFNIDVMLARRKMSVTELAARVGITLANVSVLKNGRVLLSGSTGEVFRHEKELVSSGLGVPQITRFMRLLRERGVECADNIYTVEEALREVKRLLEERRGENA